MPRLDARCRSLALTELARQETKKYRAILNRIRKEHGLPPVGTTPPGRKANEGEKK